MTSSLPPEIHAHEIPEDIVEGKRLGRHVVHDERSRNFRALEVLAAEPAKVRAWYRQSVWNQNNPAPWNGNRGESSCTVQACGGVLVTTPYNARITRAARAKLADPEFRYQTYRRAQQIDPWPGEEPTYYGSSGLAACKALVESGVVPQGWTYRWAFGGDEALKVLQYAPISVGTNWPAGFDNPDRHGRVKKTGENRGGHQYEIIDYVENDDLVIGLNSWGRRYARNGRFAIDRKEFFELLEEDGDVVVWAHT